MVLEDARLVSGESGRTEFGEGWGRSALGSFGEGCAGDPGLLRSCKNLVIAWAKDACTRWGGLFRKVALKAEVLHFAGGDSSGEAKGSNPPSVGWGNFLE